MKFKNAGTCGPKFSELHVTDSLSGDNAEEPGIEFTIPLSRSGDEKNVILNCDQAIQLRDALTVWIETNKPKRARRVKMVEGTSI